MLPKACRIRLKRDFERIFDFRRSVSGRFVRFACAPAGLPKQSISRFGIVTSAKVSKRAVVRNRLRRRVRVAIAEALPFLKPPLDIVIICQPAAAKCTADEFREDIRIALGKIFSIRL